LVNWLQKAQFKEIELFYSHKLEFDEQRKTDWMDWQSLEDFLDPNDPDKTIEGYPAPIRIYIKAVKK
jgi:tRNA (mo5U34)-methyltransferase